MSKQVWKPGNMVYPVPAALISCGDQTGQKNLLTAAWVGTISSSPAMAYVSIRPERFSHDMIETSGEFVINLTTETLLFATDLCGVKSGRDTDKWTEAKVTPEKASALLYAPIIAESPVSIECKVVDIKRLGSHDMYIGEVVSVDVDDRYLDENGRFDLGKAKLIAYSHGEYFSLGEVLGTFGFSVKKDKDLKK